MINSSDIEYLHLSDFYVLLDMSKFLPSEVARLVLSYLLENDFPRTREVFMSECPALAELAELNSKQLLHVSIIDYMVYRVQQLVQS